MSRIRKIAQTAVLASVAMAAVMPAASAASTSSVLSRSAHRMLGVVPAAAPGAARRMVRSHGSARRFGELNGGSGGAGTGSSSSNLLYHGGGVVHTNTTYAIYWLPSGATVSSHYESVIGGFLANVAAASGSATNVFNVDTQYTDGSGAISYSSTYGGAYVDAATPIPDHCSGEYSGSGVTVHGCVTDADIEAEASRAIAAAGWTPGPGKIFFVFTPRNVGSCFNGSTSCAYTYYCAYHSAFEDSQHRDVLYANQPYTETSGVGAPGVCDPGQHPNGDAAADSTINVASHEFNETITDPFGTAWWDANGEEIGDKCAWNFGTATGSTESGAYNQTISSGHYYLQQEWSNASSGCALGYDAPLPTVSRIAPGEAAAGATVTITGKNLSGTRSVTFDGASATFTVKSATQVTATVPAAAATGPVVLTTAAGSVAKPPTFRVLPTISSFSPGTTRTGASVTITGTGFGGATAVMFGTVKVTSLTSVEAGKVVVTVPANAETGKLRVRTPSGTASSASKLTILPSVAGLSVSTAKVGAWVTITGSALRETTSVTFGGVAAKFSIVSGTQVAARVPAGAGSGAVVLTTPLGSASSAASFSVAP